MVFSGGGALAAWQVGCLKTLIARHGRPPNIVSGASAGALNAVGVCCGLPAERIGEFWAELTPKDVYSLSVGWKWIGGYAFPRLLRAVLINRSSMRKAFSQVLAGLQSVLDTSPLRTTLEKILQPLERAFLASDTRLAISVTDLSTTKRLFYYRADPAFRCPDRESQEWRPISNIESLTTILIATTALPILFPSHQGLFDGGIMRNQPVGPVVDFGATLIYVLIPAPDVPRQAANVPQIVSALVRVWTSMSFDLQMDVIKTRNRVRKAAGHPQIKLCTVRPRGDLVEDYGVNLLSFGKRVAQLVDAGERDAYETWS